MAQSFCISQKLIFMAERNLSELHEKAAHHFEEAAKHHREAAKNYSSGNDSSAAHEAHLAHGHAVAAVQQQREAAVAHVENCEHENLR